MIQRHYTEQPACRICKEMLLDDSVQIKFKALPIAGAYIRDTDSAIDEDPVAPFTVLSCPGCGLVQLREKLLPEFYHSYQFVSTVAESYLDHLQRISTYLIQSLPTHPSIVEIGSNDGTLLGMLKNAGCEIEGFEPAKAPAAISVEAGIKTHNEFFSAQSASSADIKDADAIIIRHVMEHIDDFEPIFEGIDLLAGENCKLVVEVPDLQATVSRSLYSNFYHPHPCYFDLATLSTLLHQHGWTVRKHGIVDIFGGSVIVEAHRTSGSARQFTELTNTPAQRLNAQEFDAFISAWGTNINKAHDYFTSQNQDELNVGYGAAERTFSYLGTVGLDIDQIQCIYDRNHALTGMALPGSRIPIKAAETITADQPDVVVIFASSYEDEIVAELRQKLPDSTRFVSLKGPTPSLING